MLFDCFARHAFNTPQVIRTRAYDLTLLMSATSIIPIVFGGGPRITCFNVKSILLSGTTASARAAAAVAGITSSTLKKG